MMSNQTQFNSPKSGEVKVITEKQYHRHLGALPPCKWERVAPNCSVFHMSELIDMDIARWIIKIHDDYYTLFASYELMPVQAYELVKSSLQIPTEAI